MIQGLGFRAFWDSGFLALGIQGFGISGMGFPTVAGSFLLKPLFKVSGLGFGFRGTLGGVRLQGSKKFAAWETYRDLYGLDASRSSSSIFFEVGCNTTQLKAATSQGHVLIYTILFRKGRYHCRTRAPIDFGLWGYI